MNGKRRRGTERERGPKGVGVLLAANISHDHTHYTHMHTRPLKDTYKPWVILTPSEVLFWHLNLGQRKEIKKIKVTFVPPSGVLEGKVTVRPIQTCILFC